MPETSSYPTKPSEATDGLAEAAARAEAWAGEPFLRPEEEPADVLAPGRARRIALDEALEEIDAGRRAPSPEWKVRHALMLGLERVVTDHPPRLASGTELRRHQIDALAGMLAELIAKHE
jgi:ribonuclease E